MDAAEGLATVRRRKRRRRSLGAPASVAESLARSLSNPGGLASPPVGCSGPPSPVVATCPTVEDVARGVSHELTRGSGRKFPMERFLRRNVARSRTFSFDGLKARRAGCSPARD